MSYKGEATEGLAFYNLLMESKEFTSELGKVTLASGKLERELFIFLKNNGITIDIKNCSVGKLTKALEQNSLLDQNIILALYQISKQRNYLMHNIYALLTDLLEETILEKNNLLDSDVHTYFSRARQLKENMEWLTDIIIKENVDRD